MVEGYGCVRNRYVCVCVHVCVYVCVCVYAYNAWRGFIYIYYIAL